LGGQVWVSPEQPIKNSPSETPISQINSFFTVNLLQVGFLRPHQFSVLEDIGIITGGCGISSLPLVCPSVIQLCVYFNRSVRRLTLVFLLNYSVQKIALDDRLSAVYNGYRG
jgi:hypothetical protein